MDTLFLSLDEVLEIHRDQAERYGGSLGIRDMGLLLSALAMPASGFGGQYLHHDLFEMAAAHLFHLVQNHPFIDGNKRVGAAAAIIFLRMNDIDLDAEEGEFEEVVLTVAQGRMNKALIAEFFRNNATGKSSTPATTP